MDLLAQFKAPPSAPEPPRPRLSEVFGRTSIALPEASNFTPPGASGRAVGDSRDLHRVLELPRRERPDCALLSDKWTAALGRGEVKCECREKYLRRCPAKLLPVQAWALEESAKCQGLLGPIGVGDGKTLLDLLTPMVMPNCRVAVLLIQHDLRKQLEVDWDFYAQHWNLPNLAGGRWAWHGRPWLHIVAYSELSGAKNSDLLDRINPDLIIADEGQNIRRRNTARTKRFLRYMHAHPAVRLCVWSGTLTKKSIKDYAHLSNLALRDGSPTPLHWPTVEEWGGAIDPSDWPSPIGKLAALCQPGEHIHKGWRRRLTSTPGVVSSPDKGNCDAGLVFHQREVKVPVAVKDALALLETTWQRPDGEELVDAMSKARCARELACGFYYRWRWPRGEPKEVIEAWLEARKAWHKELREKLKSSREFLDSPLLCANAAIRYFAGYNGPLPTWNSREWQRWERLRDTAKPETEAVWIDDFLVQNASEWLKEAPGICWYEHDAFGARVAQLSGATLYGPGEEAAASILTERGERSIVATIRSHGTGKNLQRFSRFLVANPPSDGATWDQLVGRSHRQGQEADEVTVYVYRHTPAMRDALDRARDLSAYMQDTMGGEKKLVLATYTF